MCYNYILNKGYPKVIRGNPRAISPIDVEFCDLDLKNCFEPLTLLLSDAFMGWAESDIDDSEYSSDSDGSSDSSQTRKRPRRPPRGR